MEHTNPSAQWQQLADEPTNRLVPPGRPAPPAPAAFPFLYPAVENDELGRLGSYRVMRLLGTGGMGMVFQAEDIALCRPVALKVMRPDLGQNDGSAWARFLREARTMAAIKHDHLVTVFQVGQENGAIYLAMELLEGQTLQNRIEGGASPEVADILRIGREIAIGLAAIHARGLIHRDIKPANLWLEASSGRVKILDFGLVRTAQDNLQLTADGVVVGTPAFLSPEQARCKALDARSDLFSLGCVLYQMCTQELPFPAENTCDQLAVLAAEAVVPVRHFNPRIPAALAELVEQLLAKSPDDRPASAATVADRLLQIKRALSGPRRRPPSDATARVSRRSGTKTRRRKKRSIWQSRWVTALLVLGFVSLATLAGVGVVHLLANPPHQDHVSSPVAGTGTAPAAETTFLTDLKMLQAVNWPFHKPKHDPYAKGPPEIYGPIRVKGQLSPHGLFMHAAPPDDLPASVSYQLSQQYATFAAQVSRSDSAPYGPPPLLFSVYGDGKLLWRSQEIFSQDQAQSCTIPVQDVDVLKLEVFCAGDVRLAHAVWVEPSVSKTAKQ